MWKERLWQVFLVAILGLSLTMCSRTGSNNNTPVANAGLTEISQTMFCSDISFSSVLSISGSYSGVRTYLYCDASDDTVFGGGVNSSITHDEAFAAGWKHVGSGCGTGNIVTQCTLFHK